MHNADKQLFLGGLGLKNSIVLTIFLVALTVFAQNDPERNWSNPTPNYFALYDQKGPSPLGGIGVGAVDLAPDGRFTRMAINIGRRIRTESIGHAEKTLNGGAKPF